MAEWQGFGAAAASYYQQKYWDADLINACFAHFDHDRDGVLNEDEFHALCCDLFTTDGTSSAISKTDSLFIMKQLGRVKDGLIGKAEFEDCWKNWLRQILVPRSALIIVDVQNDFIDGSLALRTCPSGHDGAEVVPVINELAALDFDVVVYTKDHHPSNHMSFHDNLSLRKLHPSSKVTADEAKLFDTVVFDSVPLVEQTMWPRHCVQSTWGEEFHPDLQIVPNHLVSLKGTDPEVESYSAFIDNVKRVNTSLVSDLRQRGITDVYVCGLAYDVCVGMTAIDAQALGFRTVLIGNASRGACLRKIDEMNQKLLQAGCLLCEASEIPVMISRQTRHPHWALFAARKAADARKQGAPTSKLMAHNNNEDFNCNITPAGDEIMK